MIRINENYQKLQSSYLFSTISKKVQDFQKSHPEASIIRLGIGDVTRALSPTVIRAFHEGVDELSQDATFRGYGPEQGYAFLREKIAQVDFIDQGCSLDPEEVFVSDGAKCDTGNFQELFAPDIRIAVPDPVYPVYVDTNVMAGRTGSFVKGRYEGLIYLESTKENRYVPSPEQLDSTPVDLIYLCFPNNPTGATATKEELAAWVKYAQKHQALILFDSAYVQFIRDPAIPRSIFEIPGARDVAVEFRSFSKTAGFTGTRAAYTVIPKECVISGENGKTYSLHSLWNRRQTTKFNGVSYPVQKAAAAVYSPDGQKEIRELSDYYLENARLIRLTMTDLGYSSTGGDNSPYIWVETGKDSWEFFDSLLEKTGIVTTPGAGFGTCGEGYIRISAFNHRDKVEEALVRIRNNLGPNKK
ncbi:MAG: LL-diaminopimelate aminotransferase [Spirochaetales bacterium]|nr:LL-diaminopimelate aminotransferase [Spirochaetales bacterium]